MVNQKKPGQLLLLQQLIRCIKTVLLPKPAIGLVMLGLVTISSYGQQMVFSNQQHFGVEDGLPQSYISDIDQDQQGFIWLGTLDGLCRYDGRGFKTFRYRPHDSTSLTANTIDGFGPRVGNKITLFYEGYREDEFNLASFKVTRSHARAALQNIPGAIWQIYGIGSTSSLWLFIMPGYKGVGWLDNETGNIVYANSSNGMIKQDTVTAMTQSADGRIYLVGQHGVEVSDKSRQHFEFIPFTTHIEKLPAELNRDSYYNSYSIVSLPNNRLAIYTADKITVLDLANKTSRIYKIPRPASTETSAIGRMMQVDSKGRPYFAFYGRIYRISETGEMKLLWQNNANPDLRITALYIDRSDVLWVSVNAQGLLKVNLQSLPFQSYRYRSNFVSDIMEQAGMARSEFPNHWSSAEASYYFKYVYDSQGNLYISSNYYGENRGEIFSYNRREFRSLPFPRRQTAFTAMVSMPDDELWVFDQSQSAWYCWKKSGGLPGIRNVAMGSDRYAELADAKYIGGYIWLSTYNQGLLQYQGSKKINQFSGLQSNGLLPKNLTEICPDPFDKNKFWIGSRGGGLVLWHVQKGLQKVYSMEDGLPNNTIYCILADKSGKLWCSSNKGIFRFDIATNRITAFEKSDGLPGNEFNRAHKFVFPDGRLAFGGLDGYTVFNPADFDAEQQAGEVPVMLTGLQVNNQTQGIHIEGSMIREPLSTVAAIDLPYDKNYLRFEFAAMLFNQPEKIKYRYQLKGADDHWIENGTNNIANYAALRPGQYTFRINASGHNGLWSDTIKEIAITIHPPFWATWWAYLIYALLALAIIRWYFKFREGRIKAEQSLAFEKREAFRLKELDELKDRFFGNITHEFRSPLTLIISPLEKLARDPSLSPAVINSIKTAQRNSKQLLRLINEFLDFSKLDQGQMKVRLSTGELELFAADRVQSFEAGALEKNIRLSFFSSGITGYYLFDEEKWGKIIANLVGNAIKFTPPNGMVSVSLSAAVNEVVKLEVTDNGPGVPADLQTKIFDRFFQVDSSPIRNHGGTGIGLSLVKELVELMGGTIELNSQPGQPTRFIVEIPVRRAPFQEAPSMAKILPVDLEGKNGKEKEVPLILVVDDNDELRSFLVENLRRSYRVLDAADGISATNIILQELPDIVISDVMMPGRDGFELCNLCKTDKRSAHIGFILLTSKGAHDARLKGLGTGADHYITKPFHLEEVELQTANLIQLQQKQRAFLKSQLINTGPGNDLPAVTDPFLVQLYYEMDAKLDDPDLGVDYLCKVMAMSRSTLNRKLKSLLDTSPNDLVRQYRLQKATRLLSSGLDISSAAYKVGFSSPSYFSQCFKEQYGSTPSDWVSKQA